MPTPINSTPKKEIRLIAALWKSDRKADAMQRYTDLSAGISPAAQRKLWSLLEAQFEDVLTFTATWAAYASGVVREHLERR